MQDNWNVTWPTPRLLGSGCPKNIHLECSAGPSPSEGQGGWLYGSPQRCLLIFPGPMATWCPPCSSPCPSSLAPCDSVLSKHGQKLPSIFLNKFFFNCKSKYHILQFPVLQPNLLSHQIRSRLLKRCLTGMFRWWTILLHRKKWGVCTCRHVDVPQTHYAKWKEPQKVTEHMSLLTWNIQNREIHRDRG